MPKTPTDKANNVDAVIQWARYERERKIWEDQNYPLAREYATYTRQMRYWIFGSS